MGATKLELQGKCLHSIQGCLSRVTLGVTLLHLILFLHFFLLLHSILLRIFTLFHLFCCFPRHSFFVFLSVLDYRGECGILRPGILEDSFELIRI